MRACVQRVRSASVTVDGRVTGRIDRGLLVLLGVGATDTDDDARYMAEKLVGLRVFDDQQGRMNLSVLEVGGAMLIVSQFTLHGDCRKGRRPSFVAAAAPELADRLYQAVVEHVRSRGAPVATGVFRAHMEVELLNDGPVTLLIDSQRLF